MTECGKKATRGLSICIEPRGHEKGPRATQHKDDQGNTWGKVGGGGGLQPGGGLKQRSEKAEMQRDPWLQAILYGKLIAQESVNMVDTETGWLTVAPYYCETCYTQVSTDIMEALATLQPGHREERRHDPGKGVRFGSGGKVVRIGTDSWDNIIPQCPPCNEAQSVEERSDPQFSKEAS